MGASAFRCTSVRAVAAGCLTERVGLGFAQSNDIHGLGFVPRVTDDHTGPANPQHSIPFSDIPKCDNRLNRG